MAINFLDNLFKPPGGRNYGTLYFFSDGGIRLDPPAASSAVVIKNEQGQVLEWQSRVLPPVTSTEAEYYAVLEAFEIAQKLLPRQAFFHLDNIVVVGQLVGQFRVREPKLKPLHARAQQAIDRLRRSGCTLIEFYHIHREYNLLADALAADALLVLSEHTRREMHPVTKSQTK